VRTRWLLAAGNLARIGVLALCVGTLWMSRSGASPLLLAAVVGIALVGLYAVDRRRNGVGVWAAYLAGFVLFAHLRTLTDDAGLPIRGEYAVDADRWLFGGVLPTEWLQQHLFADGAGAFAFACAVVYASYFLVPHVLALVLWRVDPGTFRRYAIAVLGTVYAGLLISLVLPTAPPWMAAEHGGPSLDRTLSDVFGWDLESGGAGTNPFAAMPSLHIAVTGLVALALWQRRRLRWVGLAYALAMGFVLVATAEHYVVDLIAGAAVALVAWRLAAAAWRVRLADRPTFTGRVESAVRR
jgi:hypothetical protein